MTSELLVTERGGEIKFDTTQCHSAEKSISTHFPIEQRQTIGFIRIKFIDCRAY